MLYWFRCLIAQHLIQLPIFNTITLHKLLEEKEEGQGILKCLINHRFPAVSALKFFRAKRKIASVRESDSCENMLCSSGCNKISWLLNNCGGWTRFKHSSSPLDLDVRFIVFGIYEIPGLQSWSFPLGNCKRFWFQCYSSS